MLVLILKCCVLQYRCIILIIENDFLRKTTYQSKFCEIKYLIKKINLFDNVSSRKAILLSCMSIFAAILVRIFPAFGLNNSEYGHFLRSDCFSLHSLYYKCYLFSFILWKKEFGSFNNFADTSFY